MIVETKVVGRRTPFERRTVELPDGELPDGAYTLASLLTHLVATEVAAYQERQNTVGLVRLLTEQELVQGAAQGKVTVTPQARSGTVDPAEASHVALRAFGDGLYYVFVDDEQIESLDQTLKLRPDSTLLLLRLTALAGG
jgi:hypothetical protein